MTRFALLLYGAYFGLAFVFRVWLHHRRTGSTGLPIARSRPAPFEWIAGTLLVVAVVLLTAAAIVHEIGWIELLPLPEWISLAGAALAVGGIVLTVIAQTDMGDSWRIGVNPGDRTKLVTHGLYRVLRNPIYSGIGLFAVGYSLMVPNALSAAALLVGTAGFELQVRLVEEPYLESRHGPAFRSYARSAGRFVPGVGRLQ